MALHDDHGRCSRDLVEASLVNEINLIDDGSRPDVFAANRRCCEPNVQLLDTIQRQNALHRQGRRTMQTKVEGSLHTAHTELVIKTWIAIPVTGNGHSNDKTSMNRVLASSMDHIEHIKALATAGMPYCLS